SATSPVTSPFASPPGPCPSSRLTAMFTPAMPDSSATRSGGRYGLTWSRLKFWMENLPANEVGVRSMSCAENSTGDSLSAPCTASVPSGPAGAVVRLPASMVRSRIFHSLTGFTARSVAEMFARISANWSSATTQRDCASGPVGRALGGAGGCGARGRRGVGGRGGGGDPLQDVREVELGRRQPHEVDGRRGEPQLGDPDGAPYERPRNHAHVQPLEADEGLRRILLGEAEVLDRHPPREEVRVDVLDADLPPGLCCDLLDRL